MRDVEQSIEKKDKTDGKFGLQSIVTSSNKVTDMCLVFHMNTDTELHHGMFGLQLIISSSKQESYMNIIA